MSPITVPLNIETADHVVETMEADAARWEKIGAKLAANGYKKESAPVIYCSDMKQKSQAAVDAIKKAINDDWPCLTCNRWSQNCCGPWETPEEHDD
ncbi:hypothetical protein [uncultured Corynebacterium sp.]|uniref:hypothetical protein n=1 Tax=uncultured Corynebacterium sp. TaxID=159447 RepID=UPI0026147E52|nr:hypothetical protein [uncultured Corynebacterium sp.]